MKLQITNKPSDQEVQFADAKYAKESPILKVLGKSFDFLCSGNGMLIFVSTAGVKTEDDWRTLGFKFVQFANGLNVKSVGLDLPQKAGPAFIEGLILGDYNFDKYKSKPAKRKLKYINLGQTVSIMDKLVFAQKRAFAQTSVRDTVNGTPDDMNSGTIRANVDTVFEKRTVEVTTYNEHELWALGMQGHLAVNRASRHEAMTIKIEYTPPGNWKKHVVLVGKGLTYDSGGLDIKAGGHMKNMKCDKAGAMTVMGIMQGIADLGCDHKVTAYMAMAENMIDGTAYKADDILTMKNGTTVHVKNTDAEGRIVLFDNLCLAEEENPDFDEIYTFATLTGAAVFQFGEEGCGMVGFNDKMKKRIKKAGAVEGEIFCNAEFHKFMMNGVDDSLADISNTGTKNQGCQKAGLFLTHALTKKGKKKYLHLDIAGPAFAHKVFGSNKPGGTGFAVRTFLKYLTD